MVDPSTTRERELERFRTIVEVAGADPVTLTLRWTENGPVLPRSQYDQGAVTPPGPWPSFLLTDDRSSLLALRRRSRTRTTPWSAASP